MTLEIIHPEAAQYHHHAETMHVDAIDRVCDQLEKGIEPYRWDVLGKVSRILNRLYERGTYRTHYETLLWNLSDSANESL